MNKIFKRVLVLMFGVLLISSLNVKAETSLIEAIDGAAIRTKVGETEQGLRFFAKVDESATENEHGFYLVYGETTIEDLQTALAGTLKENISLVLEKTRNYNKTEASNKADFYLNLLHLEKEANKLPKNVSGGEAQRASIARALSIDPSIIFLDEPTSSLDPILTDEVLQAIEDLKDLGKEFVFITHVMSFVKDFADYVIYMDKGEIIEHGKPSILTNPKTEILKEFMAKVR